MTTTLLLIHSLSQNLLLFLFFSYAVNTLLLVCLRICHLFSLLSYRFFIVCRNIGHISVWRCSATSCHSAPQNHCHECSLRFKLDERSAATSTSECRYVYHATQKHTHMHTYTPTYQHTYIHTYIPNF